MSELLNHPQAFTGRRQFLQTTGCGLGMVALAELLAGESLDASTRGELTGGKSTGGDRGRSDPLRPRAAHFPPRVRNVIFLFMAGAPSQLDLFESKPAMRKHAGERVPESLLEGLDDTLIRSTARVLPSPRQFGRFGNCGMEFSDFLPHTAACADDLCQVRSMATDVSNHHPAQLFMNCGAPMFGLPSMGSWVTYGLGSESRDLPGFIVLLSSSGLGLDGGSSLWSSGFLSSNYRGVTFRREGDPVLHLSSPALFSRASQRARVQAINDLNRERLASTGDREIAARIASYELAFRMQAAAPGLLDFAGESATTRTLYGLDDETTRPFGTNCLLARRMVERGVRFVQLYHTNWDDHSDLNRNLSKNCRMTDQPAAALIQDLKQRGLLDETLVIWGGEFGRTPMAEVRRGSTPGKEGRDHHPFAFSYWLAGGGIRPGNVVGRTDDFGYHVVEDRVHVHDLQATILHLLGLDHTRLTYRHQGRDFRLTDIGGSVVEKLLG